MSFERHRQTPELKHDWKTRHVDYHVAQPSYSALVLKIGDFLKKRHTLLRTSPPRRLAPSFGGIALRSRICDGGGLFVALPVESGALETTRHAIGGDRSVRQEARRYVKEQYRQCINSPPRSQTRPTACKGRIFVFTHAQIPARTEEKVFEYLGVWGKLGIKNKGSPAMAA